MQNSSRIYPKRLHINSMMMKRHLQINKLQSIQSQNQTNRENIDQRNINSEPQEDQISNQNSQTQKAKKYQRNDQDWEGNESQFRSKDRKQQIRHYNNEEEHQQHKPRHQRSIKNSNYELNAASSPEVIKPNKLKIHSSLSNKHKKKVILLERSPSISDLESDQHEMKLIKVLNLYPKKQKQILKCKKATVMQKYDFMSENVRLAQKLLSMKPTRPCDKKQQKRFFKKQQHFKQLHSYSINCDESALNRSQVRKRSQTLSLPKIKGRYHTVQC